MASGKDFEERSGGAMDELATGVMMVSGGEYLTF